ncbi:MAG: hypothetical protein KA319_07170 [Ferruginibacter sp.]|nr:hypothetical protein [Ferruginibacter sp.]
MERVETLLKKINDLFANGASAAELLLVTQMLQTELSSIQNNSQNFGNITITGPNNTTIEPIIEPTLITKEDIKTDEKIVEVLQVDEAEIEAELEEIKRNAETIQNISVQHKPHIVFEEENSNPILNTNNTFSQKEINEVIATTTPSINDKLKQSKIDLGDTLTEAPIRDLKKAIGINDRFLFINELFRGDEAMYERSIKTINSFSILPEAEYWIQRELKTKIGWNDKLEVVQQFDQLVKRRFS